MLIKISKIQKDIKMFENVIVLNENTQVGTNTCYFILCYTF